MNTMHNEGTTCTKFYVSGVRSVLAYWASHLNPYYLCTSGTSRELKQRSSLIAFLSVSAEKKQDAGHEKTPKTCNIKPWNTSGVKKSFNKFLHNSCRARHWCLPHCPGQVEFVNYSCGAGENCILLAPLGKYALYISGLLLRMWASFMVWHPCLSLKICFHMPKPCSTGF